MTTSPPQHVVARLVLENGDVFTGRAFGACHTPFTSLGEVVFNTAMTGYQEAITDPSYSGQILTMTSPMIGNYGITVDDDESTKPQVAGLVVRELARLQSNYRSLTDLSAWLSKAGVLGLEGIDTRALVRSLRKHGVMRAAITCDSSKSDHQLVEIVRQSPGMSGQNLAAKVSPHEQSQWPEGLGEWSRDHSAMPAERNSQPLLRVLALDCGAKHNIYRHLTERGCIVHVAPLDITPEQIRELNPDGLFISNGPGDPEAVTTTIATLKEISGEIPTFGICLGHQLLALAMGATTYKLKFGHRGANQPVRNLLTGRIEITSQNHGFCVEPDSLKALECEITHIHMNDGTVAGFRHRTKPVFSVQYHPEASPGPHDSEYLFDRFIELMLAHRPAALASPTTGI